MTKSIISDMTGVIIHVREGSFATASGILFLGIQHSAAAEPQLEKAIQEGKALFLSVATE